MPSIAVRQFTFNVGAATFSHNYLVLLDDQGNVVAQLHGQPADPTTGQPIDGAIGRSTDNIRVFEYGANGPFNAPGQNQKVIWQGSQEEANARWQAARDAGDAINSRNLTYNFWGSDLNGPRDPNAPPPDAVAGNSNSVNKTLIDGMGLQLPSMPTMAPGTENELLPRSIIDQIRQNNNVTNQKSDLIDNTLDSEGRVITSIERNTDGQIVAESDYAYGANGYDIQTTYWNDDGSLARTDTVLYNWNAQVDFDRQTTYDSLGTVQSDSISIGLVGDASNFATGPEVRADGNIDFNLIAPNVGGGPSETIAIGGVAPEAELDAYRDGNLQYSISVNADPAGSISATVAGTGAELQLSNSSITVTDGAETTITGTENFIEAGDSSNVTIAAGAENSVFVDGSNATITDSGAGDFVVLNGNDDTISLFGGSEFLISNGDDNNITFGGSLNSSIINGNGTVITDTGDGDQVTLNGAGDNVTMTGTDSIVSGSGLGDIVNIDVTGVEVDLFGATVSLLDGAVATVNGIGNDIIVNSFADLIVQDLANRVSMQGEGSTLRDEGLGDIIDVLGDSNSITSFGDGSTLTFGDVFGETGYLFGDGSFLFDNGFGDETFLMGDNETETMTGSGGTLTSIGDDNAIVLQDFEDPVIVMGLNTTVENAGVNNDVRLSGTGDSTHITGTGDTTTVSGEAISVIDDGVANTTVLNGTNDTADLEGSHGSITDTGTSDTITLGGNNNYAELRGTDGTVLSTGTGNQIYLSGSTQTVTVTGENSFVSNAGTGLQITLGASGDSIDMTGSAAQDTTTLTGDGLSVRDFGTDDTTFLSGNNEVGQFYGTDGTIVSTGAGNYLILTGTQTVTVTGENTGINNAGTGIAITLNAAGDNVNMTGLDDTTTVTGDHISVLDSGTGNLTILSGNFDSANLQGSNGVLVSTGHDNVIAVAGDSQTVTVTGENSFVSNAGTGLQITLSASGDSIDMTGSAVQDTTTLTGDGLSVRDFGTDDTTFLNGNNEVGQFYGTDGTIVSTGAGNYLILTGTQTVTVSGENTGINNMGTGIAITLNAAGDNMSMNGSQDTTTVTADNILVADNGTGDTTFLYGNNDSVTLAGSNDTVVDAGGGNNVVHVDSNGSSDIVAFGPGVAYDQLWFARSNDDLVMSVIGENRSLTVADWYANNDNHVGQIATSAGDAIDDQGVEQLVQAMASFSAPPLGQTTLPPDVANDLAPALAANWHHG